MDRMRSSGKTKPLVTVAIPIAAATAAVDSIDVAVVVVVAATAPPSIWSYTHTCVVYIGLLVSSVNSRKVCTLAYKSIYNPQYTRVTHTVHD